MIAAYISACLICFASGVYLGVKWCMRNLIALEAKGVITIDMDLWEHSVKWKVR